MYLSRGSVLSTLVLFASSAPTYDPILPPSYPLAVKNPYLSAWLPGNEVQDLATAVPQFWNGQQLTWSVMACVDGQTYSIFDVPNPIDGAKAAVLQSASYTSTHTTFVVSAGPVDITLDFLSTVSPKDYIRQSLPFSYLTVSTFSSDSAPHTVQIYSDTDNSWIGQYGSDIAINWHWQTTVRSTSVFTLVPGNAATFDEFGDMSLWGTAAYCTRIINSNLTASLGLVQNVRTQFSANGTINGNVGEWAWQPGSVVSFVHDLGTLEGKGAAKNVTFVIGNVRSPAINYLGNDRSDYWESTCSDINCACVRMLDDFPAADAEARALDAAIESKASSIASNYSDVLALSVRQAFGAMEVTIPSDSLATNDVLAFVKEISSDGNVNTIDVIMPMSPILYVMAPDYIRLLLEPVMWYVAQSGAWTHNYTVHDIGAAYPNASGHPDGKAEPMPVEECGNIIILAYMYQLATGDTSWQKGYASLFQQYAHYLVLNGLYPTSQLSTDDGAGSKANQTGLAIKAAIALNAYGVMTGQQNYSKVGNDFATELYHNGAGTDANKTHFTLIQGDEPTWGLQFNLYLDVLLNLSTFPAEAYAMQTSFYSTVRSEAGVALDSQEDWGKTDWMMFAASTAMAPGVGDKGVRDVFVDDVHAFMANGKNSVPFSDKFFVRSDGVDVVGLADGYKARPVVGGHFALLAMEGPGQF